MNYRGVQPAHIVNVLEGDGTKQNPYQHVRYVLVHDTDFPLITLGKVVELTEEERHNFKHIS